MRSSHMEDPKPELCRRREHKEARGKAVIKQRGAPPSLSASAWEGWDHDWELLERTMSDAAMKEGRKGRLALKQWISFTRRGQQLRWVGGRFSFHHGMDQLLRQFTSHFILTNLQCTKVIILNAGAEWSPFFGHWELLEITMIDNITKYWREFQSLQKRYKITWHKMYVLIKFKI